MVIRGRAAVLLLAFGILAWYAGLKGNTEALAGALLILVGLFLAYIWNHFVFSKLFVERKLNRNLAEFESPITLELIVTNRKILPIFGLHVEQTITPGLVFTNSPVLLSIKNGSRNVFRDFFHLNCYEKCSRTYELQAEQRGRFEFSGGRLDYKDPFGIFKNSLKGIIDEDELIVFPRIVPLHGVNALDTYLFGTKPRAGWLFTDPLNVVGTRAYSTNDSTRQINWKTTARHLQLQVNVEAPSFDQLIYLILYQPTDLDWWTKKNLNQLEIAIMGTASLIDTYVKKGYQIRLMTNLVSKSRGVTPLPPIARGQTQRMQLLASLALLQSFSVPYSTRMFVPQYKRIKPGSTVLVITTATDVLAEDLPQMLSYLLERSRIAVIGVGNENKKILQSAKWRAWRLEGEKAWDEISNLELS